MNKKHSYDEKKSKKAIIIIVLLLLLCFGGRILIDKIGAFGSADETSTIKETPAEEPLAIEVVEMPNVPEGNDAIEVVEISEAFEENDSSESDGETDSEGEAKEMEDLFYISEITDELFEKMKGKSFKDDCTLDRADLRYVHVLHKTLDGETLEGELVVNYHIAEDTLDIFKELFDNDYPIEKIRLIDEYDADDERSMSDNNSSSFNFRFVSHSTNISKHGYGLAIDINPLYNPYIKTVDGQLSVEPANGVDYVDREADYPYKITHDDLAYKVFAEHGFTWGGDWTNSKDYQHFEIPKEQIREWYP